MFTINEGRKQTAFIVSKRYPDWLILTVPKALSLVDIAELHSSTQIINIYIEEKEKMLVVNF